MELYDKPISKIAESYSSVVSRCENELILHGSSVYFDLYLYNEVFKQNYKSCMNMWFEDGVPKISERNPTGLTDFDKGIEANSFFETFPEHYRFLYSHYVVIFGNTLITFKHVYNNTLGETPRDVDEGVIYVETILSCDSEQYILEHIKGFKQCNESKKRTYQIALDGGSYIHTRSNKVPEIEIDIKKNYNDDLPIDRIKEILNADGAGLLMFYGTPGGGKTTLVRYLMQEIERKFIFIEPSMIDSISNSKLLEFLTNHTGSVIVLEDCEKLLVSREDGGNKTLGTLLNLTDGIVGDLLGIKFICTFNCSLSKIDDALIRKGRLSLKYEFKELALDKVKKIYPDAKTAMTLADAYNANVENDYSKNEKKMIGF